MDLHGQGADLGRESVCVGPADLSSEMDMLMGAGVESVEEVIPRGLEVPWGWLAALLGWTILVSFFCLGGGADFEPTDCWVAQSAREMQEAGEWIEPRFSGETRLQKSPGAYWAVMLVSELRGIPVDEVATRVPNGVAAVVIVLVVFWLGLHVGGGRVAVFAGFAAASSSLILFWSHRGASDLGLAALVTISLACLWVGSNVAVSGWWRVSLWLLGYLFAGLGMLYKMPMPLVCVGVPAFCYVMFRRRWGILKSWWHAVGVIVFLLPWVPWVVAVMLAEPTAIAKWRVEFWDRFTGDLPNVEAQKQWHFYLMYLIPPLVFSLPYTLSLPAAFVRAVRARVGVNRDGIAFLLIWFVSLLVFFTLSVGKETRYFLPALPPLSVLLGLELSVLFDPERVVSRVKAKLALGAVWVFVPLGLVGGGYGLYRWNLHVGLFEWSEVFRPYAVGAVLFGVGSCVAAWLYYRGRRNGSFGALVGTMWLFWFWIWTQLMPILASEASFKDFAVQLRERLTPEQQGWLKNVGSQDSRIIWYSDVRIPRIIDQLELLEMQEGHRSLEREEMLVGQAMLDSLGGAEPVLLVANRQDYERFLGEGPMLAEQLRREYPESYLWMETSIGRQLNKHYVVFGNRKPSWPVPELMGSDADSGRRVAALIGE